MSYNPTHRIQCNRTNAHVFVFPVKQLTTRSIFCHNPWFVYGLHPQPSVEISYSQTSRAKHTVSKTSGELISGRSVSMQPLPILDEGSNATRRLQQIRLCLHKLHRVIRRGTIPLYPWSSFETPWCHQRLYFFCVQITSVKQKLFTSSALSACPRSLIL